MKSQASTSQKAHSTVRRTLPGRKLVALRRNVDATDNDISAESEPPDVRFDHEGNSLRQSHAVLPGIARSLSSVKSVTPDISGRQSSPHVARVSSPLPLPAAQQHSKTTDNDLPRWYMGDLTADVEARRTGVTLYMSSLKAQLAQEEFMELSDHCCRRHEAEVDVVLESQSKGHLSECVQRSVATICLLWIEDSSSASQVAAIMPNMLIANDDSVAYVVLTSEECMLETNSVLAASIATARSGSLKVFEVKKAGSQRVNGLIEYLCLHVDKQFTAQVATPNRKWYRQTESTHNHVRWCHFASAGFNLHAIERELIAKKLHAALRDTHEVLAIAGPSGCGKTWLLSQAAMDFARACTSESAACVAVVRFCALSNVVGTYARLLEDVVGQLKDALRCSPLLELDYGNDQLFPSFRHALIEAAEAHPAVRLLLVLDGLDYLLDSGRTAAFLAALAELPPGVSVLVSTKEPGSEPDDAWQHRLRAHDSLLVLAEAMSAPEAAAFLQKQLPVAGNSELVQVLAAISQLPLFLRVLAAGASAAAASGLDSLQVFTREMSGKALPEALQHATKDELAGSDAVRFSSALELSVRETTIHVKKAEDAANGEQPFTDWQAACTAAAFRFKNASMLFDIVVGDCRVYVWQHNAFGQDWKLSSLEPVDWLKRHANLLHDVLINVFNDKSALGYATQLESAQSTKFGESSQTGLPQKEPESNKSHLTVRPRLLSVLPPLLSKYSASVFNFSDLVLFFNDTEPIRDLVFAAYCGYAFITTKLAHAGVRALLHDLEDFLAVWAFKFESSRTNVERTGLTAFEQMYAFFKTHAKQLARDPTAFDALLTGTIGIDISMEHDTVAAMYEAALAQLASHRALRLSTASLRLDSTNFDPRYISSSVKNMMLRREKQYYASTVVDNQGVHLSHSSREGVKVWRSDGTLMYEKELEGRVVHCAALQGSTSTFAVATVQINTERELTLAIHCIGDCYSYKAGDLGPRDTIAAWISPDARTLVTCEKVSADTLKIKLCKPAPVVLSPHQPQKESSNRAREGDSKMTFLSRYLELPQIVETGLYEEMREHSEREGGNERTELKYYTLTADDSHYTLDVAGLDADVDGMHAMRYLWTEMRQLMDCPEYFSFPIDELCFTNIKLNDVITKHRVSVLGWIKASNLIVVRAIATDGGACSLYVLRAMNDDRLEIQKELCLDSGAVMDLSQDGLLIYADSVTPLTVWNIATNEKDVFDSTMYHGRDLISCVKYQAATSQVYAFSANAASVWNVRSCTLIHVTPWQMASKVSAAVAVDKWLSVGTEDGEVILFTDWQHISSFRMQGSIISIDVGSVKDDSIRLSCIHKGLTASSIAFLTWSRETV